jgi:hypothetical protein
VAAAAVERAGAAGLARLVEALDRLVVAPDPEVVMVAPVLVVECRAAAHRDQTLVVRPPLARPAAVAPRNCRAAGPASAADPTSAAGRGVGRTSAVGQHNYREAADRTSAVDPSNYGQGELASVAGAGGRSRRCRRTVRT